MESSRYVKSALAVSAIYFALIFFLGNQISFLSENQNILLWVTAAVIAVNLIILSVRFFRGGAVTFSVILLNLIQCALFFQIHIQIYTLAASDYACPSEPIAGDWLRFVGINMLKAADLPDIIEAFDISFEGITHQSTAAGLALFGMYLMIAMFMLSLIFGIYSRFLAGIPGMKKIRAAGLILSLILIGIFGVKDHWPLINWFLWPLDNILRALDFGDAIQIFGWRDHSLLMSPGLASAAVLFRVMIGSCFLGLVARMYPSDSGAASRSVDELIRVCRSPESSTKDRMVAVKELETYGVFAESAVPDLIKLLIHGNSSIRSAAADALREISPGWSGSEWIRKEIPNLIKTMGSSDKIALISAAEALGEIGPAAADSVSRMIALLADKDRDIRRAASESLKKIGTAAIPELVKVLADISKDIRDAALEILERIDPEWIYTESAVNEIKRFVKMLTDKNKEIRDAAFEALERIDPEWVRTESAVAELKRLEKMLDDSGESRILAVEALGRIGAAAENTVPRLITLLADRNAVGPVVESLGKIGTGAKQAIPHLIPLLADTNLYIRKSAAESLEKTDVKWRQSESVRLMIPKFMAALTNQGSGYDSPDEALAAVGPPAIHPLVKALADSNKGLIEIAAKILKQIDPKWPLTDGAKEAVPHLASALGHSEWYVRHSAAEVLGKIGPGAIKAVPFLVKGLADKNKVVRATVKASLDKITVQNLPPAKPAPVQETPESKLPPGVAPHVKNLSDSDDVLRRDAAEELGKMGRKAADALPYLIDVLADDNVRVREAAGAALEKINSKWRQSEAAIHAIPNFTKMLGRAGIGGIYRQPAEALLIIGSPAVCELVKHLAADNNTVFNAVREVLEKIDPLWIQSEGAKEAVPHLAAALKHNEWYVRRSAAEVLGKLGPAAIKAVPHLVKTLADKNKEVRNMVKETLDKVVLKK